MNMTPSAVYAAATSVPVLQSYPLPLSPGQYLQELAGRSDVLIFGEVHGTQEVPRLLAGLLPKLSQQGYHILALEVPENQGAALTAWATQQSPVVPTFYAQPWADGRGNVQMLSLVRQAAQAGWKVICFDVSTMTATDTWAMRDAGMAHHFAVQQQQIRQTGKTIAICGNLHARLFNHAPPGSWTHGLWPSFAAAYQQQNPGRIVSSVNVVFHSGGFYNGGKVQNFTERELAGPEIHQSPEAEYTLELHLPKATPATFLTTPKE